MKILFTLTAICMVFLKTLQAQDLIIIAGTDSLNAKITKVVAENIYFNTIQNNKEVALILPLSMISSYSYNYFNEPYNAALPTNKIPQQKTKSENETKFRIGVTGGVSYRIAPIDSTLSEQLQKHTRQLKRGFGLGADFNYLTKKVLSCGIKYSFHTAHANPINVYSQNPNTGQTIQGKLEQRVTIHYIGPTVGCNVAIKDKARFLANASIGYTTYRNKGEFFSKFDQRDGTAAIAFDTGVDYFLAEEVALNFSASLLSGIVFAGEGLARIDIGIGLKFYL